MKTKNEIAPAPAPGSLTVEAYKRMPANMKILRLMRDPAFKREVERLIEEENI